ncbi:LysR family transcriptional regulator [Salicibibacter cibarius]|uniref:LysR family transcriptional regulator n=1 Tax=Salicibibacter cibarius TaxID=2743000 RepID=A0A7T6Z5K7_9BACI|nr:LysR family transcriptional regulator [Salicibibacter cibarius]QQK77243.1 LysR family transcriptional regulator [Salicibibacter cibarius]
MEIKDLKIFKSVAFYGSVSKAAHELNYVQSHVTTRIQLLEKELQTQLFHRNSRGMILNPEGKKLLSYTENLLTTLDEMVKVVQDSDQPSGELDLGTVETVIRLPHILSAYHNDYPNVDLSLVTDVTENLVEQVLAHKIDGAFVTGFEEHPKITQHKVFHEELTLISNNEEMSLDEFAHKPLLVFKQGCSYRAKLTAWIQAEGIHPANIIEFGTLETILGCVVSGLGVTLLPKSTVHHLEEEGLVRCMNLPEQYSHVTTVFIRRSDAYLTNSMRKFIETIDTVKETRRANPLRYQF